MGVKNGDREKRDWTAKPTDVSDCILTPDKTSPTSGPKEARAIKLIVTFHGLFLPHLRTTPPTVTTSGRVYEIKREAMTSDAALLSMQHAPVETRR